MALDSPSLQLYDARNNPVVGAANSIEIALSNVTGRSGERKFGFNIAVGNTEETVWEPGGRITLPSAAAETVSFVSSLTTDAVGQAGAITIRIYGVANDWSILIEDLTLTGQTPALTVGLFRFINRVQVLSAGSNRTNLGRLLGTASSGGHVMASVPIGYGVTQQVTFAVPLGMSAIIHRIEMVATKLAGGAKPVITGRILEHHFAGDFAGTSHIHFEEVFDTAVTNFTTDESLDDEAISECAIVEMTTSSDTASTAVFGRIEYTLASN